MVRFKRFWIAPLIGVACTHSPLTPDTTLLRPWNETLAAEQPFQGPYLASFRSEDKELLYLAALHATGVDSETFRLVKNSLSQFAPEVLILEGFRPEMSQAEFRKSASKCLPTFESCGESGYAIHLAAADVKFASGEPSESAILSGMQSLGYSSRDLLFFYLVRQIPQLRREKTLKSSDFRSQGEEFLTRYQKMLDLPGPDLSFATFLSWYQEKTGKVFNPKDIDNETPAPYADGTYLQRLSHQVGVLRDSNILQVIAKNLEQHKKVMVIYGASHLPVQLKVLEKMLGKPTSQNDL